MTVFTQGDIMLLSHVIPCRVASLIDYSIKTKGLGASLDKGVFDDN